MNIIAVYMGIAFVGTITVCRADVITDGTLGQPIKHFDGKNDITIEQKLGATIGKNLFHSFKVFDINKGQTATFTGSNVIKNVISRVTGNDISHINGKLESTVGKAFYFINPNGVVFGEGASVDVPGAFHVSTADAIKFKRGSFNKYTKNISQLSVDPTSFGFLDSNHSELHLNNANLNFDLSQDISFSANKLKITSGEINNSGGVIRLIGNDLTIKNGALIKSISGKISLQAMSNGQSNVNIHEASGTQQKNTLFNGKLSIDDSRIAVDGDGGGGIALQAGHITINHNSTLSAQNNGSTDSSKTQGMHISNTGILSVVNNSQIKTGTYGDGKGGEININTKQLNIKGAGSGIFSEVGCNNACPGNGNAGDIIVHADDSIYITDSGVITSSSFSPIGHGGAIRLTANKITMHNDNQNEGTGIFSESCSNNWNGCSSGTANAGDITLNPNTGITRLTNSQITTSAKNNGNGGAINIGGKALVIKGGFIQANANGEGKKAGNITITADTLLASHGQVKVGDEFRQSFQPGINVIQAAAENGESGTIDSIAPELNINGAMLNLKSNFLQNANLNASPCKTGKGSSLMQAGHGRLPQNPSDAVYIPHHVAANTNHAVYKSSADTAVGNPVACKPIN